VGSKIMDKLGLMSARNVSYQQILNNLMDGTHNINLKSRIPKPMELATLYTVGQFWKRAGLERSAGLVDKLITILKEYWISEKGEGRREVVKALSYLIEDEKRGLTSTEKLSTNVRKL